MDYLFYSGIGYAVIGVLHKDHRSIWLIVSACMLLQWFNVQFTDVEGVCRYWNRAVITTVAGTCLLIRPRSWLSFYHSIVLLVTLVTYAALAYDVAHGRHILIYNNYEAFIYGLVGCQLIAIFPTLWAAYRNYHSSCRAWLVNLQRYTRT